MTNPLESAPVLCHVSIMLDGVTAMFFEKRNIWNGPILRETTRIDVPGIGPVDFERATMFYLGQRKWHVDFTFTANGTRYFGTVWNRTREVTISGIYEHGTKMLPAHTKAQWREGLKRAGFAVIDYCGAAREAALAAGDEATANAIAMGRAPAPVEAVEAPKPAPVRTIDVTPTWSAIVPVLLAALENGTDEGKRMAREEIMRMADLLDAANAAKDDI